MSKAACKVLICLQNLLAALEMNETAGTLAACESAARELGPDWDGAESPWQAIASTIDEYAGKIRAYDRKCANALKAVLMPVLPQAVDEP